MFSIAFMKKFGGLFLLIALSVIAHWQWLVLPGIFTSGDYWYVPNQVFSESLTLPKILDASGSLTTGISQPTFVLLYVIGGLLTKIHLGFAAWERIVFLWPIAILAPIPIYLFLLKTLRYPPGAFAGSLIYLFNTYILAREMMHLHIAIVYFLAPLLFIAVRDLLHRQNIKSILSFIAITGVCSIFEIRILYILTFMLIAYSLYLLLTRKIILSWKMLRVILCAIIPVALLQSYWLIPFIFANSSLGYGSIVSRGLFRSYDHIGEAMTLYDPFWSGNQLTDFIPQQIPRWEYIIPIIAFLWLIVRLRAKKNSFFWFWSLIAIIGIFLVKQENNPFPQAYSWLYYHFPGFNFFRESSKLKIIVALALSALSAGSLLVIQSKFKKVANALILGLSAVMLINIIPLSTGAIEAMTVSNSIDNQFLATNKILESDAEFGRVLWVPSTERFTTASQTHPRLSLAALTGADWLPFVQDQADPFSITAQPVFKALLNFSSIRYIGEPADQIDHVYQLYNASKTDLGKNIAGINNLKPVQESPLDMPLWKNPDAKPHAYVADNLVAVHGAPRDFSGLDPSIATGFVFQSNVQDQTFQHIDSTIATNSEYIPFSPDSISIEQGQVHSNVKIPDSGTFQTVTRDDKKDSIAPILLAITDQTLSIIARMPTGDIPLATTPNTHQDYAITINGVHYFYTFTDQSQTIQLGITRLHQSKNSISFLAKINSDPLVKDASFEAGTWGSAGDCNNSDNTTKEANGISASQSPVATDGASSLNLTAKNHIACTGITISSAAKPATYFGSIDYQQKAGSAGYVKIFQSDTMKNLSFVQFNQKQNWQHADFSFDSDGTHNSTLYLYQPAGDGLFDNIHLDAYQLMSTASADIPDSTERMTTRPYQTSDTTISDSAITGSNVLAQTTFSPDMSVSASDCNNADSTSVEKNGIKASIAETADHIQALSIQAAKHIACVTLPLHDFNPTYDHLVSIRYRTILGTDAHATFYPNDNPSQATIQLPETNSQWQTKNIIINGSNIHPDASLILYVPADSGESQTQFASIAVTRIPILPSRFIQTANPPLSSLDAKTEEIDPTTTVLHVSDIGSSPRMLILSNRFDPGWKVFVRPQGSKKLPIWERILFKTPGQEISKDSHIQANALMNGWILDPQEVQSKLGTTQNIDIVMEYWPQRYMNIGVLLSLATLVLYTIGMIIAFLRHGKI